MITAERLHGEAFDREPEPVWRALRHDAPVFHDAVDNVYVITRHQDVREALLDTTRFSNRLYRKTLGSVFGPTLLQMDGHEHVRRRTIVAPPLNRNRLESYRGLIDNAAAALVSEAVHSTPFDLVSSVSNRLPGTVIAGLLGLPVNDHQRFFEWYDAMMAGLWTDAALRRRGRVAAGELADYVAPLIDARRACPADDLISRLVAADVDGRAFDDTELKSYIALLLTAGGETTDKSIANLWWLLLSHPDEYLGLRADGTHFDAVFSETMRLFPPLVYIGREAASDIEWHGVRIPAGAEVRLCLASANRDETVFANPDRFHPDRADLHQGLELRDAPSLGDRVAQLGFGAGPHFCVGNALARFETQAVTAHLLAHLSPHASIARSAAPVVNGPIRSVPSLWVTP